MGDVYAVLITNLLGRDQGSVCFFWVASSYSFRSCSAVVTTPAIILVEYSNVADTELTFSCRAKDEHRFIDGVFF